MLKVTIKNLSFTFLAFLHISLLAQTDIERKAGIAGEYWGAVILADEFLKTQCGRNIGLKSIYLSTSTAISEIKSKFPASMSNEINETFSKKEEARQRGEMRQLLNSMNLNKCLEIKTMIDEVYYTKTNNWKGVK